MGLHESTEHNKRFNNYNGHHYICDVRGAYVKFNIFWKIHMKMP